MYDCEISSCVSNSESDLFCTESVILSGAVLLYRNFHKGGSWQQNLKAAHCIRYFESRSLSQIAWRMQSPASLYVSPVWSWASDPLRRDFANQQTVAWATDVLLSNRGIFYRLQEIKFQTLEVFLKKKKKSKIDLSGSVWIRSAQILHIFWRGTSGDRKSMTL